MKSIYIFILLIILMSCKKGLQHYDDTARAAKLTLPPYSQAGANTFGFLMNNDSVWTVFGAEYSHSIFSSGQWVPNTVSSFYGNPGFPNRMMFSLQGELTIVKQDTLEKDYLATMNFFPDTPFTRTYSLSGNLDNSPGAGDFVFNKVSVNIYGINDYYFIDSNRPFTLKLIRFDTAAKICSGVFSGTVYGYFDSMTISQGRFDVRYH
ncbi:MAG TPA: hypothetical protein VKR53_19580 [Puia sp.]|nr:hypothetical protein [Puia sp.]